MRMRLPRWERRTVPDFSHVEHCDVYQAWHHRSCIQLAHDATLLSRILADFTIPM
jgi:hypothetical protein